MKLHTNLRKPVIHAFFYSLMRLQPGLEHSQNLKILFIWLIENIVTAIPRPNIYVLHFLNIQPTNNNPKLANKC